MGLFKKIFAASSGSIEEKVLPWIALTTIEQLDGILKNSKKRPQIIFKYSTRCGISRVVLKEFERDNLVLENYFDFYFNDLIKFRNVSNHIASQFNIRHQSPQLMVIKNGEVISHSSHGSINDVDLKNLMK
ncbi:bacillithiol system redox-active protein YtxJ [Yeosuana sp. MJ-SS3]|uniref:Bacillithiol system redox-active protein YtxJ n=1 Tax=Gilvirhabdus luticola TaxID=3079858 RepID=A0ABU3U930_9FLAO|nr:bacillithiol system redox-active protein YtxJ [Yeosuana sp. MJ-SS3]MDU8886895.1 bacillithiol system redox-active protein YtxJ [Yeosuana sp. MJ-SS3]